jgi:twinkle protein
VSLSDLRGSGSLEQLSDNVIALERNQQSNASNRIQLRVLKCRETGASGEMDVLNYNKATGRLELAAARQFNEDL